MNPVTFAAMLLLQQVDEALRLERLRSRPDPNLLTLLQWRSRRLRDRIRRSLGSLRLVGN